MKDKRFIVYKHTSPSGKVYIGQTCQKAAKRFRHDGTGYKGQIRFCNAIAKYGWNNFKHDILFSNLSKEEADLKEIELIKFYNSTDKSYGYNTSIGGDKSFVGMTRSDEFENKLSIANKGKKLSEEHKKKIGASNKGNKPWTTGKHLPQEIKDKISASHKGIPSKKYIWITKEGKEVIMDMTCAKHYNKDWILKSHHPVTEQEEQQ